MGEGERALRAMRRFVPLAPVRECVAVANGGGAIRRIGEEFAGVRMGVHPRRGR